MRAAIVENGLVVNLIVVDDLTFPVGEGRELVSAEGGVAEIGWIRQEDGTFAPPAEEPQP